MNPKGGPHSLEYMEKALEITLPIKEECIAELDSPDDYPQFIRILYDSLVVPGYWVPGDLIATYFNAADDLFI